MYPHTTPPRPSLASVFPIDSPCPSGGLTGTPGDPSPYRARPPSAQDLRECARDGEELEHHGGRPSLQPAVCNTQAETSEGVDYVALTCKSDRTPGVFASLLGVALNSGEELPHGGHLYKKCWQYGQGVRVYYDGMEGMGSYCQISGEGCRELEAKGIIRDWQEFAIRCVETYALKCRRLDLFRDDCAGVLDIDELERKCDEGECTTHAREVDPRGRKPIGMEGRKTTRTLNIGSRKSESFMRIYDKTLELRPKGKNMDAWRAEHGHHVRVELELKVKRAHKTMQRLAQVGFVEGFIAGMIRAFIDFKVSNAGGKNGNRVPTWGPWVEFLAGAAKVKLAMDYEEASLTKVLYFHEKQYGPTIAAKAMELGGDGEALKDWLMGVAKRGVGRMGKKHHRMVLEAERARGVGAVA